MECDSFNSKYTDLLGSWAKENRVPLTVNFELTPFCNFSCVMCYVRLDKKSAEVQGRMLTADEWLDIAAQAKAMGTLNLALTGGEPLTHPDFWYIYSRLNKMGFLLSILTNGSLIDEAVIEKFRMYGMPYRVKITLYGASDETYLRTCGSHDGFTKVSKAIDLLKAEGVPLTLTSTVVHENADDLQAMYRFAAGKGLRLQHTVSVLKSSRGSVNSVASSRFALSDFPDELSLEQLEHSKFPPLASPFAWCASKDVSFWMTWHGHMQLCAFMCKPYIKYSGDISYDYERMLSLLDDIKSPLECSNCEWADFCQRCPGILCAESSDPEKTEKGLCDMAKRLYEIYLTKKGEKV